MADGVDPGRVGVVRLLLDGGGPTRPWRVRRRGARRDRRAAEAPTVTRACHCELCEAARITQWFYEDDLCWIAECEICAVPMVVWQRARPDAARRREGRAPRPPGRGRRRSTSSSSTTSTTTCATSPTTTTPTPGPAAASSATASSVGIRVIRVDPPVAELHVEALRGARDRRAHDRAWHAQRGRADECREHRRRR